MNFKKAILIIAGLFPLATMAQSGYTISGKMSASNGASKAYILTFQVNTYKDKDSVAIKDGKFQFKGSVTEPEQAIIEIKYKGARISGNQSDHVSFLIENSNISIVSTDSIKNAQISGSTAERERQELSALTTPFTNKIIKLQREFSKGHELVGGKTAEERKAASDSINSYVTQIRYINQKFVEAHRNTYMGLYTFNVSILGSKFDPMAVEPMFHQFSAQLQSSTLGRRIAERIETAKKGKQAQRLPTLPRPTLTANRLHFHHSGANMYWLIFGPAGAAHAGPRTPTLLRHTMRLKAKTSRL